MELIKPSYEIIEPEVSLSQERILRLLERFGKVCYQSKSGETEESGSKFIRKIIDRGHESVIEHLSVTVIVVVDRGVTHEWVRHRIAAYSQESTRYCNYGKKGVRFIIPPWLSEDDYPEFIKDAEIEEQLYLKWLGHWGNDPQKARWWLPQGTKSQLVATHNLREWRHIFRLRDSEKAHPQMVEVMHPLHLEFIGRAPVVFGP